MLASFQNSFMKLTTLFFCMVCFFLPVITYASSENEDKLLNFSCTEASIPKPTIDEKATQPYLTEILHILKDPRHFNAITSALMYDSALHTLSEAERGVLLSLCLYHYSQTTGRYRSEVQHGFGEMPYFNLYFDAQHEYAVYPISANKILFVQLTGRGAHNNAYIFWDITIDNGNFYAKLLTVPNSDHELLANRIFFDFMNKKIFLHASGGDVYGYKLIQNIYQIQNDKLILVESNDD